MTVKGWGQTNYVSWDFSTSITSANYSTNQTNQNAARSTALTGATFGGMTLSTVTGATANTFHRTTAWHTGASLSATHYIEYSITLGSGQTFPDSALNLAMSVQTSSATAAPTRLQVRYGYGASPTFANAGTAQTIGASTTNPSVTIPAPGNTTTTQLTIRLHGYSSTSATGNLRIITSALTGSAPLTPDPPAITGAATATAFTTTYGSPSTAQTFSVSGANLTANLTATAPTGFEVASDGVTYGSTATFTQSSGTASGTLSVRLRASAAVSGTYNSQNIVLSSTGATAVNIVTSSTGNSVSPKGLTITASAQSKTYGSALALGTSAFTSSGLENAETIGSVTLTSDGSGSTAVVDNYDITPSAASGGTFSPGNYSITYNTGTLTVDPKALTITADTVTKPFGATLSSPVTGSSAFTSAGLVGSETIGSVTITYGTGSAAEDSAGDYPNQVTPSLAVGGTFDIANYAVTYVSASLTVTADPTITLTGSLAALSTTYGTASSVTSFGVSGIFLTGDLTVTPPAGFEVSTTIDSGFASTLLIPASGTLGSTPVYLRLAQTTAFGAYSGDVTVSGGGATSKILSTSSSSVARKELTITGLSGGSKVYDRDSVAPLTGTAAYVGLENSEEFAVTGTPTASFTNATVGIDKVITVTGYTPPSNNYTLTPPTGLTGNITPLALTVSGAVVTSKVYNGNSVAAITGATLVGVISPDVVTIATSSGTFSDVNVGTGIPVTAALTLGGANVENYTLTQPTGLTGNITKANQTITFATLPEKLTTDAPFTLNATTSSGLPVTFLSSDPGVASVSGSTATIVGLGSTNITASQAGDGNYNAATSVVRELKVNTPILSAWDLTGLSSPTTASATVVASNLDSTNTITRGPTAGASAGGNSFRTTGFQNNGISTANSDYFQTVLSASPGYTLSIASIDATFIGTDTFRASPGVSAQFAYSLDGTNFTLIGSPFILTTNTSMPQISLSGISALQSLPASTTVTFRYYASGQTTTGGWGFSSPSAGSYGLRFGGTIAIQPTIIGEATASAFTTTYGTPSAEQDFSISGSNLTANLVASAPIGFEVSNDGVSYASTATFTPTSGSVSGTLRVRLSASAPSGSYNSLNIVLSSTSATSVNIVTPASGNLVSQATPTILTPPTASTIVFGQSLASSVLTGGSASVPGTFAFTSPATAPSIGTASQSVTFTPTDIANYTTATTTTSVTVIAAYDDWSAGFPGFADTGESSNPDSDSLSNLLEFAFGTNPTVSNSGLITYADGQITSNGLPATSITNITNGVDYRAVFGRRKDHVSAGLTYTVQFSAGLDIWVDSTDTPTVVASDATMEAVTVPYPFFIETARGVEKPTFFRVAVTSN